MRKVLESYRVADVRDFLGAVFEAHVGFFEAAFDYPAFGSEVAELFEVAFESGKASSRVVRDFVYRKVVPEIAVHELENIYLPRVGKVEQRSVKVLVGVEDYVQSFGHFQLQQLVRRFYVGFIVRFQRFEQAFYVGAVAWKLYYARGVALGIVGQGVRVDVPIGFLQKVAFEGKKRGYERPAVQNPLVHHYVAVLAYECAVAAVQTRFLIFFGKFYLSVIDIQKYMLRHAVRAESIEREIHALHDVAVFYGFHFVLYGIDEAKLAGGNDSCFVEKFY